jgi:hypothetical protein
LGGFWERDGCEDTSRSGRGCRSCTPLSPQRMEIPFFLQLDKKAIYRYNEPHAITIYRFSKKLAHD